MTKAQTLGPGKVVAKILSQSVSINLISCTERHGIASDGHNMWHSRCCEGEAAQHT
jgi:hypothetical protein